MENKKYFHDEKHDIHNGHEFIVRLQRRGHRCGYVRVNDHALFKKIEKWYEEGNNDDFDFDVHGGITFVRSDLSGKYLPPGDWIGFDCNHFQDLPDMPAATKTFDLSEQELEAMSDLSRFCIGHISRPTAYVENECRNLAKQMVKCGDTVLEG